MQAGTSAPGGLVDLVVKRPLDAPLRSAFVEWRERGSVLGAVDLSQRFGADARLRPAPQRRRRAHRPEGARRARPPQRARAGRRLARRRRHAARGRGRDQPPLAAERAGLQPARRPACRRCPTRASTSTTSPGRSRCVFDATTASLRLDAAARRRTGAWSRTAVHAAPAHRRPRSPSRSAAPTRAADVLRRPLLPRRHLRPLRLPQRERAPAQQRARPVAARPLRDRHRSATTWRLGVLRSRRAQPLPGRRRSTSPAPATSTARLIDAAGADADDAGTRTATSARPSSTVRDAIALGRAHRPLWLGARHTRLRAQRPTARPTAPRAAPLRAVVHDAVRGARATPSRRARSSTRAGAGASRATSRLERCRAVHERRPGAAGGEEPADRGRPEGRRRATRVERWRPSTSRRPRFGDIGACDACAGDACTRGLDGTQRHRGVEASGAWRRADRGRCAPACNGCAPRVAGHGRPDARRQAADQRAGADRCALHARATRVAAVPGLALQGGASYESAREVLPDNSVEHPAAGPASTSAPRYEAGACAGATWTLRVGVDNLFDRRAWRESPYQFGHVYLFPLAPRTLARSRCRRTSERGRPRPARYNSRLFLDSSVGRAPDC